MPEQTEIDNLEAVVRELNTAIRQGGDGCEDADRHGTKQNHVLKVLRSTRNDRRLHKLFIEVEEALGDGAYVPSEFRGDVQMDFRKAILGYSPSPSGRSPSRARILATILDLGVDFLLAVWVSMLHGLEIRHSDVTPDRFTDEQPLSLIEAGDFLGRKHAALFEARQYDFFPVSLNNRYEQIRDRLLVFLKEGVGLPESEDFIGGQVTIERFGKYNERLERSAQDRWFPETVPWKIFEAQQQLVKELFVELYKSRGKPNPDSKSRWLLVQDAERHSRKLYAALNTRAGLFAILLICNCAPADKAWLRFEELCLTGAGGEDTRGDNMLPLCISCIKHYFGLDDIADHFYHTQWQFCAVKFERGEQVEWAHDELRLPLRSMKRLGDGAFGTVYKVEVEPGYIINFDPLEGIDRRVAMKEMPRNPGNYREWDNAALLLKQHRTNQSIMMPIASLQTFTKIYILYPLADYNLGELMQEHCKEGPQNLHHRQLYFRVLIRIANAIKYLHYDLENDPSFTRMLCIHGDLKRENVLITFDKSGLVENIQAQVTDFGISKFHHKPPRIRRKQDSGSAKTPSQNKPRSLREFLAEVGVGENCVNFPPEALEKREANSKIDVYAFGVLVTEFIAWLSGGAEALKKFEERREQGPSETAQLSFEPDENGTPRIKQNIRQWFENLINDTPAFRERVFYERSWSLVENKLLVCDPAKRSGIQEVCDVMKAIAQELQYAPDESTPAPGPAADFIPYTPSRHSSMYRSGRTTPAPTSDSPAPDPRESARGVRDARILEEERESISPKQSISHTGGIPEESIAHDAERLSPPNSTRSPFWKRKPKTPAQHSKSQPPVDSGSQKRKDKQKSLPKMDLRKAIEQGENDSTIDMISKWSLAALDEPLHGKSLLEVAVDAQNDCVAAKILRLRADRFQDEKRSIPTTPYEVSLLFRVAEHGMLETTKAFLNCHNLDTEIKGKAFRQACQNSHSAVAIKLLESGATVGNYNGDTDLHYAVLCDGSEGVLMINHVLKRQAFVDDPDLVNKPNSEGETALIKCVKNEAVEHVRALLEHNADPNRADEYGRTPLDRATKETFKKERQAIVTLLVRHNAQLPDGVEVGQTWRGYNLVGT